MALPAAVDTAGVAVITGGASGFGLTVAERLVRGGMAVALLDVSAKELAASEATLRELGGRVCVVHCDVTKFEDCQTAQKAVAAAFPGLPVSFLFNNAGILGHDAGLILEGGPGAWSPIFSVNVFGAVHTMKAFLPAMIEAGPLPSGKKSILVTTSSVVGLLNHNIGPYSVSKMAVTALCEQLALELEAMGPSAAHISPRSLHPTVAGTNFLTARSADGSQQSGPEMRDMFLKTGASSAADIVDGFFRGLDEGRHYIVVDHPLDVPTTQQIATRMEDQMSGRRPRKPEQLGAMLQFQDPAAFKARKRLLKGATPRSSL